MVYEVFEHVGWCKWMYEDYAFGGASMRGDQPPLIPENGEHARPPQALLTWLTEGHQRWLASVGALSEDLRRHLEFLPVNAREDTVWYRVTKFIRRHPGGSSCWIEASGGITVENLRAYGEAGADTISVGALTHSAPSVDIALDFDEVHS